MIVRFERNQKIKYGWMVEDRVRVIEGDIFNKEGATVMTGLEVPLTEIRLLPPCRPSNIIYVGLNYRGRAEAEDMSQPEKPLLIPRGPTSLIGPSGEMVYPSVDPFVYYEVELAVVIKKTGRNVPAGEAEDYIMGYTSVVEIMSCDHQQENRQWSDFCLVGPGIVPKLTWSSLGIELSVNGQKRQKYNTSQMIFGVPHLIEEISKGMTLLPGDVILTGAPARGGEAHIGDQLEARIENIPLPLCAQVVKAK